MQSTRRVGLAPVQALTPRAGHSLELVYARTGLTPSAKGRALTGTGLRQDRAPARGAPTFLGVV
ncbi:MAG: hypothetical protein ACXWOX_01205 [Ktedonobacteraceae bacterium]